MIVTPGGGPAFREGGNPERWRTIRYALRNWGTTARFCLIMLVMFTPPAVTFWLVSKRWV